MGVGDRVLNACKYRSRLGACIVCVHWAVECERLDGMTAADAVRRRRRPDDNDRTLNALAHAGSVGGPGCCVVGCTRARVQQKGDCSDLCRHVWRRVTACTHTLTHTRIILFAAHWMVYGCVESFPHSTSTHTRNSKRVALNVHAKALHTLNHTGKCPCVHTDNHARPLFARVCACAQR